MLEAERKDRIERFLEDLSELAYEHGIFLGACEIDTRDDDFPTYRLDDTEMEMYPDMEEIVS